MSRNEIPPELHAFRDLMARWRHKVHVGNMARLGYSQSRYTGLVGGGNGGLWSDPVNQLDEEVLLWETFFGLPDTDGLTPTMRDFLLCCYIDPRMAKQKFEPSQKTRYSYIRIGIEVGASELWNRFKREHAARRAESASA